jgi:DNA invertase Pin-like site-specific DNA recombinase
MKRAYAYLRKSRVFADQDSVSPEMQLAAVEAYAAQFGDANLVVLTDMNISGRKGRNARPGFAALLTAIEDDEVSAIYSYSLSRLSRSVRDMVALADLCKVHGVPIRLARDQDPDPTTATGRALLGILAVMAQMEAELAQERAVDAVAARRARGDRMGGPVFADHDAVIRAYQQAGSMTGAARLLTVAGVPTRNGKAVWYPSAVRVILERTAPEILPPVRLAGVKRAAPFTFYRLLRCHCGTTLTGWRRISGPQVGYVSYRCTRGRLIPGHGVTHVPETAIMEWAVEEIARLRPPADTVSLAESTDAAQASLRGRLDRLRVAFLAGLIEEPQMRAEKTEIDEAIMRLELAGRAVRVPAFDWNHEPRDLNLALRALWEYVELGPDLRPVRAEWLVPENWLAPSGRGSPAAPPTKTN